MNCIYKFFKFSTFILLLVVSFILSTQMNVYAQDSASECTEPAMVPECSGSDADNCSTSCGSTFSFCCPLSSPAGCGNDFGTLCNGSNCDASDICMIPDQCKGTDIPQCSGATLTSCSVCSANEFCCPTSPTASCNPTFNGLCNGNTCTDQNICQVPEPPPPPPVRTTRNLTFINNCTETVWVGGSAKSGLTDANSGFELSPKGTTGNTTTISVPGNLQSANFWPRTSCTFPCTSVPCCQTGDCANSSNMVVECKGGTKAPPANSFEVTFNESPDNDFYDITNVDGYTIGIAVQQMNGVKLNKNPTINGVPAPQLNCGSPVCTNFEMSTCPPELSDTTDTGRQICWGLGGAANDPTQRATSMILQNIASSCHQLALVGAACSAEDTNGNSCGTTPPSAGCGDSVSLFCCSPYNDNLPSPHGGIGCADATDPNYVNACSGVWPTPDASWCTMAKIKSGFCTYNGVFEQQCNQAYSWQFNDSNSTYQCINPDYQITFCPTSANTDHDGLLDSEDTDSDNDGIPNEEEMASGDFSARIIPDDPDGDGIPNELDLDSDGDCIPDHIEGGGKNDADRDGFTDNFVDIDGDGLHDEHDVDQMGNILPIPDSDEDEVPDFLDTDSDNDGVSDTNEANGLDADENGLCDDSEDRNQDGLADSVHPSSGAPLNFTDSDNDGILDHLDADDQNIIQGCSLANKGRSNFNVLWLFIPAIFLARRMRRRK